MLTLDETYFGVIGQGKSGKTTHCKRLAAGFRRAGAKVLALPLPGDVWAEADWQTNDLDRFDAMFWKARQCAVFIEFADAGVRKSDDRYLHHFTKGRHQGHRVFAIAQRHTQLPTGIRDQLEALWLFSCGRKTAVEFADAFADDAILEAIAYPRFKYLFKRRCQPIQRGGPA